MFEVAVRVGGEAVGLDDAEEDSGVGDLEGELVSLDERAWEQLFGESDVAAGLTGGEIFSEE